MRKNIGAGRERMRLEDGRELRLLSALAGTWAAFDREENPSPEDGRERALALKKAWSTRLMSAFAGACSGRSGPSPQRSGPRK